MKLYLAFAAIALHVSAQEHKSEYLDATEHSSHSAVIQTVQKWNENETKIVQDSSCMEAMVTWLNNLAEQATDLLVPIVKAYDPTLNRKELILSYRSQVEKLQKTLQDPLASFTWVCGDSSVPPAASQQTKFNEFSRELSESEIDRESKACAEMLKTTTIPTFFSFDPENHSVGLVLNPGKGVSTSLSQWNIHVPTLDQFTEELEGKSEKGICYNQITKARNNINQATLMVGFFQGAVMKLTSNLKPE